MSTLNKISLDGTVYDIGSIKTLKADETEGYVSFYLEDMEDGTYVVKNISKEYPVSFLCYPELIKDKTDKTYNIYNRIMLHNNDILQLFKVGDDINDDTRIRHIPTNDSKITCFSIKEINEESDETSYSWNRDYIGLTEKNYSTSRYDTYNCHYLNGKLVNVSAEEDDNFKVNFIKSKNLYNPSYRANDGTIKSSNDTGTESNGVFTLVASVNDSYFWEVTTENSSYTDDKGELYEFKKDTYTISLSNTAFNNNFITYYDANKVSLGYNNFGNSTFTINKSDKTGAKYFTIRFGKSNATPGTTYSTTVQLEEGKKASAYKPFVPSSIYVDNEKFTETIGVGSSVDSNYRVNVLHSSNLWHYNTTKTTNGVTSTYENSTITLNGTAIGSGYNVSTNSAMLHLNAGNYALKLTEISGTKPSGQSLIIRNVTSGTNLVDTDFSTTNTYTFALSSDADIAVMVYFWNNNVFDNYKFGVQLQEGSKTDAYKPYGNASIVVDGETIYSVPKVLWTNPSPSSTFAGQNITLSSDDYNHFEIIYSVSNYTDYAYRKSSGIIPFETGKKAQIDGIDLVENGLVGSRRIITETSKTSFTISNNQFMRISSSSDNNIYIIPLKIIGYKY